MTIKSTRCGYRWVDSEKCEKNFRSKCSMIRRTLKGDMFGTFYFGKLFVVVWADTSLTYIIY